MTLPENCNQVTVQIPGWSPAEVTVWLGDARRLFGLHPDLRIDHWQADPDGGLQSGWQCHMTFLNERNGIAASRRMRATPLNNGWRIDFDTGWLAAIEWHTAPHDPEGTALSCIEIYHPRPEDPREQVDRLKESQSGLIPWSLALRRHLRWHRFLGRWTVGSRFLRWFATLVPAHRRIARLLVWSSLLELALLFVGLLCWRLWGG